MQWTVPEANPDRACLSIALQTARDQHRLAENAKFSPRNTMHPALLQGLLVCDIC
jgi:hypothetical protein